MSILQYLTISFTWTIGQFELFSSFDYVLTMARIIQNRARLMDQARKLSYLKNLKITLIFIFAMRSPIKKEGD